MTGEELLALDDDAFSWAWFNMPVEGRDEYDENTRRRARERYVALDPFGSIAAGKKHNGHKSAERGAAYIDAKIAEKHQDAITEFVDVAAFINDIRPPEWLVDGIIQRSYLYGLTAPTNHGKTALAALLAVSVGAGLPFAGHDCEAGHVLYLAGENPEDFKLRLRGVCQANELEPVDVEGKITVMPVVGNLTAFLESIKNLSESRKLALIIIDTSVAYFGYEDENANVDARRHAQDMRMLIASHGAPAVVALCHPVKNAAEDNLVPRGGSAFMNELDCNLTLYKTGEVCEVAHNKLRGPPFSNLQFKLTQCVINGVTDTKGREINTVIMKHLSESAASVEQDKDRDELFDCMRAINALPKPSLAAIANRCGWKFADGKPAKSKVARMLKVLIDGKYARKELGIISLTDKGKGHINYAS